MGKSITGEVLVIREARIAFTENLFRAGSVNGGLPQFSSIFIIPPTSPAIAMIQAEEERLAKLAWGDNATNILAMIRAGNNQALKPGILKAKFDGFQGNMFVSASSKVRPTTVSRAGTQVDEKDGAIYSGCYTLGHISLWTQDNEYGQKINANLLGVQFLRDGDAFSGGPAPSSASDFANLDADGGGDGLGDAMS